MHLYPFCNRRTINVPDDDDDELMMNQHILKLSKISVLSVKYYSIFIMNQPVNWQLNILYT